MTLSMERRRRGGQEEASDYRRRVLAQALGRQRPRAPLGTLGLIDPPRSALNGAATALCHRTQKTGKQNLRIPSRVNDSFSTYHHKPIGNSGLFADMDIRGGWA
jgi:hypothetical protein